MKKYIGCLFMAVFFSAFIFSDEPAKPVLKSGDVDHFIKTFPSLSKELKKFGSIYDARKGEISFPQAITASREFQDILTKYNWDSSFFIKSSTIIIGYSIIRYGKELNSADDKMSQSLKEIESNPDISPEMKKQLRQQLTASQQMMKVQGNALRKSVHPKDIELIKPFVKQLATVLSDKTEEDKETED